MCSPKLKFDFPYTYTFIIILSVVLIYVFNKFLTFDESLKLSVLIYGFMAIYFNYASEKVTVWNGIIKLSILILSFFILYSISNLSNWELSTVIKLFALPAFWLVLSLLAQYLSNRIFHKKQVFIGFKLISLVTENRISYLDVIYSIIGWLSIISWLIIMSSSK